VKHLASEVEDLKMKLESERKAFKERSEALKDGYFIEFLAKSLKKLGRKLFYFSTHQESEKERAKTLDLLEKFQTV
jgi:hypothetical protein